MFIIPRRGRLLFLVVALALIAAWIAVAQQARQVNDETLAAAGRTGEEWISYSVNWSEQRYSPLDQIDISNVDRLGLSWYYDIPAAAGNPQNRQEGTPLVHNGVMYSIAPWSVVYAIDARTGKEVWHQDPDVNQQVWQSRICCGVVNRGLALYEDKVIAPVVDGRLRAYDAATGRLLWDTRVSPDNMAYTITMAPRVIKGGRVIVGVSGGEYGVRGFFDAYDVNTGEQVWRRYTVPGDPSKPFEHPDLEAAAKTWSGDWWRWGGGAPVWGGMAYDPDADLVYVGTGQPAPWTSVTRGPGDNLYANSILAVRGATGQLVWYYQEVPGDDWDYDSIADLMLADLQINGRTRKVIMHAPKDGFFYVLDRLTGELLSAEPYVTVTWASGINMKTGRPVINPEARYEDVAVQVMPGPGGGHVWPPWSYNPNTGLVYIPGTIGGSYSYRADPDFVPTDTDIGPTGRGKMNMGTAFAGRGKGKGKGKGKGGDQVPDEVAAAQAESGQPEAPPPPPLPQIGPRGRGNILIAWDPVAQKERWRGESAGFNSGGTLSTPELVFASVNTRLLAYNAENGDLLKDITTGVSQAGPPMTFMIDGKQFVAVAGGPPQPPGGRGGRGGAAGGRGAAPEGPRQPSRMLVFALDGEAELPPPPSAADNN